MSNKKVRNIKFTSVILHTHTHTSTDKEKEQERAVYSKQKRQICAL